MRCGASAITTTAVIVTGAPGAGKSSVLEKLATLLEIEGIEFSALESEQLSWGSPPLSSDAWIEQLSAVMELQRQAGRSLFLIAATTETGEELTAVREALAVTRVMTVLLTAPPDVVTARIDLREPDTWPGKQQLIEHARHLAISMRQLPGIDVRIDTEQREASDVALAVREALRADTLTT